MRTTTARQTLEALHAIRSAAIPLAEDDDRHDALLRLIGDARFVLLGEASHGTHEFYDTRARITRSLITEKGFQAVAIEGDWPDAYRVNRHVRGHGDDVDALSALAGFARFPRWMWRNGVVVDFVEWLRRYNADSRTTNPVGFYGLDLYSMNRSMEAVLDHLDAHDPDIARFVRGRYACFEQFGGDSEVYGLMTGVRGMASCESAVQQALRQVLGHASKVQQHDGDAESELDAAQNAQLVKNAEAYYRAMYLSDESSWNVRDRHMADSLRVLEDHLSQQMAPRGQTPKIVVWAHNSHLGDARATEMGKSRGELNLGQLMRERHGDGAFLLGFSTHTGSVTAASDWGQAAQCMTVRPSRDDSHEGLMHASGLARFLLPLRSPHLAREQRQVLNEPRLERAIGVIYRPGSERWSHYFSARLAQQFDALIHIDTTRALDPLDKGPEWRDAEAPETYPSGI